MGLHGPMTVQGCRCGHIAQAHYMKGNLARTGACQDRACGCRAFAAGTPATAAPHDPMAARPITPPRYSFPTR